jgi:hypothetical protein
MVFTNAQPFPFTVTPISGVTPFTYPDGITFLEKLEKMRLWLNASLVPEFNAGIDNAIAEFQAGIANAELEVTNAKNGWQAEFDAFTATNTANDLAFTTAQNAAYAAYTAATTAAYTAFEATINGIVADAITDIATEKGEWQASFDAFMANVQASLAPLNDAAIVTLLGNNASPAKLAIDAKIFSATGYVNIKNYGAIGDGVTDDSAAINTALANNRDVFFPRGTYMVSGLTVSLANARLKGDNGAILKKRANGELVEIATTATNTIIDGIILDGNSPFTGVCIRNRATGVTVQFCYAKNAVSGDATIHGSQGQSANMTIRYCTIEGSARAENADNFTVDNCRILPSQVAGQGAGLGVWSVTSAGSHADNARFTNNRIDVALNGFAIVPLSRNGAIKPRNVVVSGNTIVANQNCYGGISMDSCGSGIVSNNTFFVAGGIPTTGALEVVNSDNIVVTGNHFDSGSVMPTGIVLNNSRGCNVSGNKLTGVTKFGIWVNAPLAGNNPSNNLIANNNIEFPTPFETSTGIVISVNNVTATAINNVISDNRINGNNAGRGITLDNAAAADNAISGTVIDNNKIYNTLVGVQGYKDFDSVISRNRTLNVTNKYPIVPANTGLINAVVIGNSWQTATAADQTTTGWHVLNENLENSAPAVGQPMGWVCTSAGLGIGNPRSVWIAKPNYV